MMKINILKFIVAPMTILLLAGCAKRLPSDEELKIHCQNEQEFPQEILRYYPDYSDKDKKIIYDRCMALAHEYNNAMQEKRLKELEKRQAERKNFVLTFMPTETNDSNSDSNTNKAK